MHDKLYLRPVGLIGEEEAADHWFRLAGTSLYFTHVEVIQRRGRSVVDQRIAPLDDVMDWAMHQGGYIAHRANHLRTVLLDSPPPIVGLSCTSPHIMGILNVTPDSFFDGKKFLEPQDAIRQGEKLVADGAEILDVGGESTRPGAKSVSTEEQCRRILPVIRYFASHDVLVSVDTCNAAVMRAALDAGATLLNDVSALTRDPNSYNVATTTDSPIILMHMQGTPQTMQHNPTYDDATLDIFDWLEDRIQACVAHGISAARLIVDPGIGFGKTVADNVDLLRRLAIFHGLGCPILLGVSRKSFIAHLSGGEAAADRLPGSLAAAVLALDQGVTILRVHDVAETCQALAIWSHLRHGMRQKNAQDER